MNISNVGELDRYWRRLWLQLQRVCAAAGKEATGYSQGYVATCGSLRLHRNFPDQFGCKSIQT